MTAGEFDLLKIFAKHPNRPLSRDPVDRAIDLRITRIRRKLEPDPGKPAAIRTVRGIGYMFVPPTD